MFRRCLRQAQQYLETPSRFNVSRGRKYNYDWNQWKSTTTKSWNRAHSIMLKRCWGQKKPGYSPNSRELTPMQRRGLVYCVDNTNCRQFLLLQQVGERFHHTRIVPVVIRRVAILRFKSGQDVQPRQKFLPGTIMYAHVLTRRQPQPRQSGLTVQFDKNTGILLNEKLVPVGTRVMYAAGRHINHRHFLKTAVMANFIV